MNLHLTRTTRVAAALGLAVTLAACGGGDDPTLEGGGSAAASSPGAAGAVSAEFNDADVTFIQQMAPHHGGALAMAELAPTRADSAQVKDLAARIAAAQGPEIELMQTMARTWDVELEMAGMDMSGPHSTGMDMSGMDMSGELESLSGAEFDRAFLTSMIAHHEGALPMARAELAAGVNPQARQMAQDIVTTQTAEIAEMKQLLSQL